MLLRHKTLVYPYRRMYIFEQFKQHMDAKRQRDNIPHQPVKRSRSSGPRQYKRKTQMDDGVGDRYGEDVGEFYNKNDDSQDDSGNYGKSFENTAFVVVFGGVLVIVIVVVHHIEGGEMGEQSPLCLFP